MTTHLGARKLIVLGSLTLALCACTLTADEYAAQQARDRGQTWGRTHPVGTPLPRNLDARYADDFKRGVHISWSEATRNIEPPELPPYGAPPPVRTGRFELEIANRVAPPDTPIRTGNGGDGAR